MNRILWTTILLLLCQACEARESADIICYKKASAAKATWSAVEFIDADGKSHRVSQQGSTFTPIQRLRLEKGKATIQTWGGEMLPAQVRFDAERVVVEPRYLDWLGSTDPIGLAAKRVAPFGERSVVHLLRFSTSCSASDTLRVEILNSDTSRRLGVVRMAPVR